MARIRLERRLGLRPDGCRTVEGADHPHRAGCRRCAGGGEARARSDGPRVRRRGVRRASSRIAGSRSRRCCRIRRRSPGSATPTPTRSCTPRRSRRVTHAASLSDRRGRPAGRRDARRPHRGDRGPPRHPAVRAARRQARCAARAPQDRRDMPGLRRRRSASYTFSGAAAQYCPTCQTGGALLERREAARTRSRRGYDGWHDDFAAARPRDPPARRRTRRTCSRSSSQALVLRRLRLRHRHLTAPPQPAVLDRGSLTVPPPSRRTPAMTDEQLLGTTPEGHPHPHVGGGDLRPHPRVGHDRGQLRPRPAPR